MFRRNDDARTGGTVAFIFDGRVIEARPGDSVAAALLAAGMAAFRDSPVSGTPRGPYCMMGVCFECLVEIDGQPNRQACMVPVAPDMVVTRQHGVAIAGDGDVHED